MYCLQMTEPNLDYTHVAYRNFSYILRILNVCTLCVCVSPILLVGLQ